MSSLAGWSKYLKTLIKKYEGKVKLVFRHFPLDFHKMAKPAAIYFEAVAMEDHEKARKFHDILFENSREYATLENKKEIENTLQALIKKMKVNVEKITENKKDAEKIVQKDLKEANQLKVSGTPTFFINGVQPPFDPKGIETVIERHLKES